MRISELREAPIVRKDEVGSSELQRTASAVVSDLGEDATKTFFVRQEIQLRLLCLVLGKTFDIAHLLMLTAEFGECCSQQRAWPKGQLTQLTCEPYLFLVYVPLLRGPLCQYDYQRRTSFFFSPFPLGIQMD